MRDVVVRWLDAPTCWSVVTDEQRREVHRWAQEHVLGGFDLVQVGWAGEVFVGRFYLLNEHGSRYLLKDDRGRDIEPRTVAAGDRFLCASEMPPPWLIEVIRGSGVDEMMVVGKASLVEAEAGTDLVTRW